MVDRPILFSGPMVRALLAGSKTQTRRIIQADSTRLICPACGCGEKAWKQDQHRADCPGTLEWLPVKLPRIAAGDRLYVREHWRTGGQHDHIAPRDLPQEWAEPIGYIADEAPNTISRTGRFRQDMHMPRWASRLALTVTGVRVERLQDISEEDAVAEGIEDVTREVASGDPSLRFWKRYRDGGWNGYVDTAIGSYASLWTEINGPGSWEANPWVAAYTFTVAVGNIDGAA